MRSMCVLEEDVDGPFAKEFKAGLLGALDKRMDVFTSIEEE